MSDYLTFNSIKSSDYGIFISGAESFSVPEYDLTFQSIPGRSGDLTFDNHRFMNIKIVYPAFIRDGFEASLGNGNTYRDFFNAMKASAGYFTLTSTYDTDHFRLATFTRAIDFVTGPGNRSAKFDLEFDCKPQRFRNSGTTITTLTADGTITNPTDFDSLPLLRVYGTGTVTVNGTSFTINTAGAYTDVDSEIQDCFRNTVNCNNNVTLTDFPVLSPGSNTITLGTGITSIKITPRWWEL